MTQGTLDNLLNPMEDMEYEARMKAPESLKSPTRAKYATRIQTTNIKNLTRSQPPGYRPLVSSPAAKADNARRASKCVYSDRFIPSRSGSNLETGYCLLSNPPAKRAQRHEPQVMSTKNQDSLSMLLQSEYLGVDTTPNHYNTTNALLQSLGVPRQQNRNLYRFQTPLKPQGSKTSTTFHPLHPSKSSLAMQTTSKERKVSKTPFKILDAPALQDDFYLNLVDWSSQNVLAVGLGTMVYLWSASTSKVTKLCDLGPINSVTSVSWTPRGGHLAVGTSSGGVQIWDTRQCKLLRTMHGHSERVGTLAWNSQLLATGSRDKNILLRDVRSPMDFSTKLASHKQEICGLRWSFDDQQLASGGNDNKLLIWNCHSTHPVLRFTDHTAAVKALAWSPHQHGLLASGGGTADRCIRFWNTHQNMPLQAIDTGSQVCNLMWSKNSNEVVSTHGYSLNQIIVWKYPTMTKVTTLTGHTYRVLYLAMSPDGQTIVTGAGDETLRFWNAFPGAGNNSNFSNRLVFPVGSGLR